MKEQGVIEKLKGRNIILVEQYQNSKQRLLLKCGSCQKTWRGSFNNVYGKNTRCPFCHTLNKDQKALLQIIEKIYTGEKVFLNFRGFKWLKNKNRLEIDIYVPHIKLAIEYDGQQHFQAIDFFGGKENFEYTKKLDKIKNDLINRHKDDIMFFVRFPYWEQITKENVVKILKKANVPVRITE